MSNSNVVIPPAVGEIIRQRIVIWEDFDRAHYQATSLEKLASKVGTDGPSNPIEPLADPNNPPAELLAALGKTEAELKNIDKINADIRRNYDEIAAIKRRKQQIIIWSAIAAVILVLIVVYFIAQLF
jgi:hypothetical protein